MSGEQLPDIARRTLHERISVRDLESKTRHARVKPI